MIDQAHPAKELLVGVQYLLFLRHYLTSKNAAPVGGTREFRFGVGTRFCIGGDSVLAPMAMTPPPAPVVGDGTNRASCGPLADAGGACASRPSRALCGLAAERNSCLICSHSSLVCVPALAAGTKWRSLHE